MTEQPDYHWILNVQYIGQVWWRDAAAPAGVGGSWTDLPLESMSIFTWRACVQSKDTTIHYLYCIYMIYIEVSHFFVYFVNMKYNIFVILFSESTSTSMGTRTHLLLLWAFPRYLFLDNGNFYWIQSITSGWYNFSENTSGLCINKMHTTEHTKPHSKKKKKNMKYWGPSIQRLNRHPWTTPWDMKTNTWCSLRLTKSS